MSITDNNRQIESATLLLLLWALSPVSTGAEGVAEVAIENARCQISSAEQFSSEVDALEDCSQVYPADQYQAHYSPWKIGIAAGVGERSNPLINSDDIPIYAVIQLSYFGDHFFFDNGDLGWYLGEGKNWSANAIAGVGGERSFYSFLNNSSVGFDPSLGTGSSEGNVSPQPPRNPEDQTPTGSDTLLQQKVEAPDRKLTVDGGVEFLYQRENSELQLQLLTDISGRHKGQELWFSWAHIARYGSWEVVPSLGLNWKSSQAANYYYGVKPKEASLALPAHRVGAAVNPFARLSVKYQINDHWKLISLLQYESLDSEIKDSPAVEDDKVETFFVGLYYEF